MVVVIVCGGIYIYIYIYIAPPPHSASCNMRISKCASALRKNTTSASCDDHHEYKWSICAS